MRGLTLHQPFASFVAWGDKLVETRSWQTPYRGDVLIHAAKTAKLRFGLPGPHALAILARRGLRVQELPRGAALAIARLVHIFPTGPGGEAMRRLVLHYSGVALTSKELELGDYSPARFGWVLSDLRPLREPLPCEGTLGLWPVQDDLEAEVRRLCGAMAAAGGL